MITMTTLSPLRRKALSIALQSVLSPAQLTAARELTAAENPGRGTPQPEDVLYWMRVNMPDATRRVEDVLHG